MASNVSIDRMADEIMRGVNEYAGLATEDMKEAVKSASKKVQKDIKANAPKDTGAYQKSWTTKKVSETSNRLHMVVHSKNRYQLAHLLEYGHAKRNGGRVDGKAHIAPAEQAGIRQLQDDIERALRG